MGPVAPRASDPRIDVPTAIAPVNDTTACAAAGLGIKVPVGLEAVAAFGGADRPQVSP